MSFLQAECTLLYIYFFFSIHSHLYFLYFPSEESEDDIAPGMERFSPPSNDGNGGEVQNGGLSQLAFSLTVEKARLTILTEVNEVPVSS